MITLGIFDPDVQPAALETYMKYANQMTGVTGVQEFNKLRGVKDSEWVSFQKAAASDMKVADVQRILQEAGFFPFGKIDGICGYRTASAIRLFQEYVRTVEGDASIGYPDGVLGATSAQHLQRWKAGNKKADWTRFSSASPSPDYTKWMNWLGQIKQKYSTSPTQMLQLVNQQTKLGATLKVASWDFSPNKIHLVGIRRNEAKPDLKPGERRFDDGFALLINGLVFKFYGSTDPGATESPKGAPFLVHGQHHYRFGWHKLNDKKLGRERAYHALKPAGAGVLVVRSKDLVLNDADLAGGVEINDSINIHWGGEGVDRQGRPLVGSWSEGCQVIVGKGYINHQNKFIDCSENNAHFYDGLGIKNSKGVYQTRGAYTVMSDLVAALSGDDNIVHYTLAYEQDLSAELGLGEALEILKKLGA